MSELDLTGAQWCKSSYNSANGAGAEVTQNLPEIVAIRDSKNPDGPKLLILPADWRTFASGVKGQGVQPVGASPGASLREPPKEAIMRAPPDVTHRFFCSCQPALSRLQLLQVCGNRRLIYPHDGKPPPLHQMIRVQAGRDHLRRPLLAEGTFAALVRASRAMLFRGIVEQLRLW